MKRFACLSFILLASCGDDGGAAIDAASIDAAIDARPIDAAVDAAPTTFSGTLTALEVAVLNPTGAPTPFFGQGLQVGISFADSVTGITATMEEQPGSPLGCKLFEYNRAQAIQATVGNNEGDVTVTIGTTALPVCKHTANVGYTCPHTGTASTGGTIAAGPAAGTATLTDADVTFNAGNTTNRYVNISGATTAANNGTFPIVGLAGANTIVYANPGRVAEMIPATGNHVNLAGVGPTPSAADPGFVLDADLASFAVTPGGGNHFTAFTSSTGNGSVGDDFVMLAAEQNKLNAIPNTGAAFSITCEGGTCGAASGSLLLMVTTDSPVAGLSPFALPLPTTKRTMVRCAAIGSPTIMVPAPYMAALMGSGWTRIQSTFMRPALMSGGPANVNALGGHAIVGFTNRPAN